METLSMLWLPIVLSAVAVFIASFLAWMMLPHHKRDWAGLPQEDAIQEVMRKAGVSPGLYTLPHCSDPSEMKKPEVVKKLEAGPVVFMTVTPSGVPTMGKSLVITFIYYLVISLLVGYLTRLAGPADGMAAFRISSTAAILAYAGALAPNSIWFKQPWSVTFKHMLDGVVYGLITAGIFAWLWP